MDPHCVELLKIAKRIEELSKLMCVDEGGHVREGGQWIELPEEKSEKFDSDLFYIRRFALMVVREYIYARETDDNPVLLVLELQENFNERYPYFIRQMIDFKSEFLKYLRLCGGDGCLRVLGGVFDTWVERYKPNSDSDSVDTVHEFEFSDDRDNP
jgi:hypothetical protein